MCTCVIMDGAHSMLLPPYDLICLQLSGLGPHKICGGQASKLVSSKVPIHQPCRQNLLKFYLYAVFAEADLPVTQNEMGDKGSMA